MQLDQRGGVIVNIGSSKAGIQSLTETVALEGKPFGLCALVLWSSAHSTTPAISAYCVVLRGTSSCHLDEVHTHCQLLDHSSPRQDPTLAHELGSVADVIVSVALDASPLLSGQSVWVKCET